MNLTFSIDYYAGRDEALYISGTPEALGAGDEAKAIPMWREGHETWKAMVDIDPAIGHFSYNYIVRYPDGTVRREWGKPHSFNLVTDMPNCLVEDRWEEEPSDRPYHSSAFTDCFCHRTDRISPALPQARMLTMKVRMPMVNSDEALALVGSSAYLGEWQPERALRLSDADYPEWALNLDLAQMSGCEEYKLMLVRRTTGAPVAWEKGENRHFHFSEAERIDAVEAGGAIVECVAPPKFDVVPWRGAGVAIPVFSLRSEEDFGVGDFYDLKLMVDWAAATGQNIVQILPIHDTTMTGMWTDSYPYNANSAFALHPMYLRVEAMGTLKDEQRRAYYEQLRRELSKSADLDYEKVNRAKNEYTRELFAQDGAEVIASDDFRNFYRRNESWLRDYALWCLARDLNNTPDMTRWGEYECYATAPLGQLIEEHRPEYDYVCYLQYYLDRQLKEVRDYAHGKGIAIKGDIPIGISRTSVDAWVSPHLFNLDCQAGAPPDSFAVLGQNWGFPTYNWAEMAKDSFGWWKARFRKMAEYFDAYRIDHVLGFFRIWQIPFKAIHGLLGTFNRALPFTPEELKSEFDFTFRGELYTTPYITDEVVDELFCEDADECRKCYLEKISSGSYRLRDEVSTQRKIAGYFSSLPRSEHDDKMCAALMLLVDEVLFIEDPYEKGKYHPRISAWSSYIYKSLSDYERKCFDRLYEEFYYHRMDQFWYEKAMWKLPALIEATDMLVCAEDLGMIPGCVPEVMEKLQILVLEIQRMPKAPGVPFGDPMTYPYLSVCTTSSHDMDGIRRWWESDRELTRRYYHEMLGLEGEAPFFAEPWVCEQIIRQHLESPSMLCILPLQDWLSIDGIIRRHDPREELINIPSNPRHYWRYRMHLTLEYLNSLKEYNNRIRDRISASGRR